MQDKNDVLELVYKYEMGRDKTSLKELIKRIIYENLTLAEYEVLSNVNNSVVLIAIILKAPIEVVSQVFEDGDNCRKIYLETLETRLKKRDSSTEADKLIDNRCSTVRVRVAKYVSKEKLVKRLSVEKDEHVVTEILENIKDYKYSKHDILKLADSSSWDAMFLAFNYAIDKSNIDIDYIELKNNLANRLLHAPHIKMNVLAAKYASLESLVENLHVVNNNEVFEAYIERLKDYKFSQIEADRLMDTQKSKIINLVGKYASQEKVAEILIELDDCETITSLLQSLE